MGWIIVLIVIAMICVWLDSIAGKIAIGAAVITIGMLLLTWITGIAFFATLAKVCAVVIVIVVMVAILCAIFSNC